MPKFGKKKKKKGKKDGTFPHIGAALIPNASIAAVPEAPPPSTDYFESSLGMSTGVLNTSMVRKMFATSEQPDDTLPVTPNEADSSIGDYQHVPEMIDPSLSLSTAFQTSYSSVEMRHGGQRNNNRGGDNRRFTYSDRARVPTPDEEAAMSEGEVQERMYHILEPNAANMSSPVEEDPAFAVYAQPVKGALRNKQGSRRSRPSSYQRRESSGEDSPERSPTLPRRPGSGQTEAQRLAQPGTSQEVVQERVERMMMSSSLPSYKSAMNHGGPVATSTGQQPASKEQTPQSTLTRTPKLASLQRQNQQLLEQQQQIEYQLQEQQRQQQEIMQRLQEQEMLATSNTGQRTAASEMGTLLQDTQSVTEGTLQKQEVLIKSLRERTIILEQEKVELNQVNEALQQEIKRVTEEEIAGQTPRARKQLKDYKDENSTLKTTIHRLNVELSKYQSKYDPPVIEKGDMVGLPSRGPIPSWLINTKYLSPLFMAYDDKLAEKDRLIDQYELELTGFRQQLEEVIKENQRLHLRIEQTDISGPISMTEWRQLQEQAKLVLEENQLLMEQLDVQQNKAKDMHTAHVQEVAKLSKRLVSIEAEKEEADLQLEEVRSKFSQVKQEHNTTLVQNKTRMTLEDHVEVVAGLKQNIEDQKTQHIHEVENLKTTIQTIESDCKGLSLKMESLVVENKQLQAELKALNKAQRKSQKKVLLLQSALSEAETKEMSASQYLSSVVKVAEKTAQERDSYATAMHTSQHERQEAINTLLKRNVDIGKMEERLKVYKMKLQQKLDKAANRMKEQDSDFSQQCREYEREIKHLRVLLQEREDMLEALSGEKKNIEDDLEVMWQAASKDNQRMQDVLRKSLRKLRDHEGLANKVKNPDQMELLPCTSDNEEDDMIMS